MENRARAALAHTASDNVETILHRIIRGTGLVGLRGIRPRRLLSRQPEVYIVRPMLCCRRAEIEQFLAEQPFDAVLGGIDIAELTGERSAPGQNSQQGSVDDGGRSS